MITLTAMIMMKITTIAREIRVMVKGVKMMKLPRTVPLQVVFSSNLKSLR